MNRFLQTQPTIPESESDGSTLGGSCKRGFLYLDDTYYIDVRSVSNLDQLLFALHFNGLIVTKGCYSF